MQGSGAYWNGHPIQPFKVTRCANAVIQECGLATVGGVLVACGKLDTYLGKPLSLQEVATAFCNTGSHIDMLYDYKIEVLKRRLLIGCILKFKN